MSIKKIASVGCTVFVAIVALAVFVSAKFSIANIMSDPYVFITNFFSQWSPALSAAGALIVAILALWSLYESRHAQTLEREQVIHALHDEIHSNLTDIVRLRVQISEKLSREGESRVINTQVAPFQIIDTTVFDNMKNAGQLYWLQDLRTSVITYYKLAKQYSDDASFQPYHLEHLSEMHEGFDRAIRALEAKFKFLPRYMKSKESESVDKQNVNEDISQTSRIQHEELRKEYFLAQAPAFLAGSYYIIQSSANIGLSIFLMLWALFLCYLAIIGKVPQSKKRMVYRLAAGLGSATLLFFLYGWIQILVGIIQSDMPPWYYYLFYSVGLLVLVAVIVYPLTIWIERFRKKHDPD